jgi:hypothetical protein
MILKEWKCLDCETFFESSDTDPVCPHCTADEPERAFLTPPGIKSQGTSFKDETVKQLAADYGLSDMSNKDGAPVRKAPSGPAAPQFAAPNPQIAQAHAKLGGNADGFSSVLPALQGAGGPRNWAKVPERR